MGIPLLEPALAQRASRWETRRGIPGLCSVLPLAGRRLEHEPSFAEVDGALELDHGLGRLVAVGVEIDEGLLLGLLVADLTGLGERLLADERELLVALLLGVGIDQLEVDP